MLLQPDVSTYVTSLLPNEFRVSSVIPMVMTDVTRGLNPDTHYAFGHVTG
jgi:hypothetical protein